MLNYRSNASKLHRRFGQFLIDNNFLAYDVRQEVIVQSLCSDHDNGRDSYDYYIKGLSVVVELHGEQHYRPVTFGGVSKETAQISFGRRVKKDMRKLESAARNGYIFVEFSYEEDITLDTFNAKIQEGIELINRFAENKAPVEAPEPTQQDIKKHLIQNATKEYWRQKRLDRKNNKER
jgi:hypothetical protein